VIADDHRMVAQGLAGLLAERCDVVAIVENGRDLLEAERRLRPRLVIADVAMPEVDGLEALRRLRASASEARVILLTMHRDAALAAEALRAGAAGYLFKHCAGEELLTAVEQVLAGRVYLTPRIAQEALGALGGHEARLTPRQREVLRLLGSGLSMKEVAARLDLSTRTVETHKYEIMRVLGAKSTADLVRHAIRLGLVAG
jgi:DNA-binding NarL/FixJ family response regulator